MFGAARESATATALNRCRSLIDFYFDGSETQGIRVGCDFDLRLVPFKLGYQEVTSSNDGRQKGNNDDISEERVFFWGLPSSRAVMLW